MSLNYTLPPAPPPRRVVRESNKDGQRVLKTTRSLITSWLSPR